MFVQLNCKLAINNLRDLLLNCVHWNWIVLSKKIKYKKCIYMLSSSILFFDNNIHSYLPYHVTHEKEGRKW